MLKLIFFSSATWVVNSYFEHLIEVRALTLAFPQCYLNPQKVDKISS